MTSTPTSPHTALSATRDVGRLLDDTEVLLATAIKDSAARVSALTQPAASDGDLAFVERIKCGLKDAKIEYAARTADERREDMRVVCNTLLLFRACPRATCRKARTCRGDPAQCRARFDVPQPVEDYAAVRMLGRLMPWLPMRGSPADRQAYECWIAGLEAGVGESSVSSCAGLTRASILFAKGWIAGSSPAMTAEYAARSARAHHLRQP